MPVIRTPDKRFAKLADFPFTPRYLEVNGLRMHYIDEGQGEVLLCLHGILNWSYHFRTVIARLSQRCRVIAPDLVGFGRSDKLSDRGEYSFTLFVDTIAGLIDRLGLEGITLIGHNGGCVIGLIIAAERPDRFSRLVIMNTDLPTGDQPTNTMYEVWKQFVHLEPDIPVEIVLRAAASRGFEYRPELLAAYAAPFPDKASKTGAAVWPHLVPTRPGDAAAPMVRKAREALSRWHKPAITIFSEADPIYAEAYQGFQDLIPTAKEQPAVIIQKAGHFLLDEKGDEVVRHITAFLDRTPLQDERRSSR